jgi:nicotinate-nucleotide adenylyltransferase
MLGIFGGTFDPIHYGHLSAAWQVYQTFKLTELRFMPCNHPPHRAAPVASSEHRLNMLKLAIKDIPGFTIDDRELKTNDISYTVTSLTSIRNEIGAEPLCLILGADAFNQIHTWHEFEKIFKLADIIVLGRPDITVKQNKMNNMGRVFFEHNTLLDISASHIRNMLHNNLKPKFLLPDAVLDYIKREHLYVNN